MANRKIDADAIPSWTDACYKLDDCDGNPLGISASLWDEISVHDAHPGPTYSGTPISHVPEISSVFYSSQCSQDGFMSGCPLEPQLDPGGSPRPKRRRMLEYPEAASADYNTNFQHPEYQVESSQESSFTQASQGYGYQSNISSSPYWYANAGPTASNASTEEHGWLGLSALHSPLEQMVTGDVLHPEQAWVQEHPTLQEGFPKFPKDEITECEFLDTKIWPEHSFQHGQADQKVEHLACTPQDRYYHEMNPMSRSTFASPGLQMLIGRPVREELAVQAPCTPFPSRPSTPGSQLSTPRKPKPVTPLPFCPFDVVKPLPGVEGNVTLEDINQRISTPKARSGVPAFPPFAEDASRPNPSETGIGLSGKSVVSLRTIHTQGAGSVTIIRTKD